MPRPRVQMPPKAISRQAWTPAERIGSVIVLWTMVITIISFGVILYAVLT